MANAAVVAALQAVLKAIREADGKALRSPPTADVEIEVKPGEEGGMAEECPACAAGECMDPDHASDDELSAAAGY